MRVVGNWKVHYGKGNLDSVEERSGLWGTTGRGTGKDIWRRENGKSDIYRRHIGLSAFWETIMGNGKVG